MLKALLSRMFRNGVSQGARRKALESLNNAFMDRVAVPVAMRARKPAQVVAWLS